MILMMICYVKVNPTHYLCNVSVKTTDNALCRQGFVVLQLEDTTRSIFAH